MPEAGPYERLIRELSADLRPVRRLRPPALRTLGFVAVVTAMAGGLAWFADLPAIAHRLGAAPDMWLALVGSALTGVLATLAAFQLSLPDRPSTWALLPLPTAVLWVGASGLGCLRTWVIPDTSLTGWTEERVCLAFILGVSIPLSVLLQAMLRLARPLRPNLTTCLAGLASAASAASLLVLYHPFDAALTDLVVHTLAVTLVVLINTVLGSLASGGFRLSLPKA